jgi:hypothetical protein
MILEKQKEANVLVDGQSQESIGMSLDLDSAQILMQMLSKNLYSDDIGSTIRECASNALDSHRRAGVKDPIIVAFKESSSYNYEFSVEDFGIGLDADDVKNIISKYGKSTKRESTTELGMMGLGFKAPLAYSSSFYFVCRKDGMERKYMMYEGEDVNTIDLLHEAPTTERNGVKVIVPVKYQDQYQFRKKIKEQLCYFEDVYFDVPSDSSIHNEFVISRHPDFQFSELCESRELHICLDNVYYPLDFDKIGSSRINFPIALRFSLTDGIYPTPNRESIRYTQEAKEIIKSKLSDVADYFINKYNEGIESGCDIRSMINHLEKSGKYIDFNGSSIKIDDLAEYATVQVKTPKLEGLSLIDFATLYNSNKKGYLLEDFTPKFYLHNKRMMDATKGYNWYWKPQTLAANDAKVYIYEDKLPGIKKDYLRSLYSYERVFLVKPSKPMTLGNPAKFDIRTYYHLLDLKNYPKNQWRDVIKEYQSIIGMLSASFINLDELEVPQEFIDSKKKIKAVVTSTGQSVARGPKLKGEVIGKRAEELMKWSDGRNCKFVPITYKLEEMHTHKMLRVYAHHDDYLKIDALYGLISKQKMEVVTFSQRELTILKDSEIHNLISLETFMEGNTAPFKRMATAYYIRKLMDEYKSVFERSTQIGYVSTELRDKLFTLAKYVSDNYVIPGYSGGSGNSKEFLESMLSIAEENNLFDMNMYPEALEMRELLTKLVFLNPLCARIGYYNEEDPIINVMTDLFKYYKHRVNLKHYNIRINEEVLTEETIENLVD